MARGQVQNEHREPKTGTEWSLRGARTSISHLARLLLPEPSRCKPPRPHAFYSHGILIMSNLSIASWGLLFGAIGQSIVYDACSQVRPIGTRFGSAFCCFRGSLFSQSRLVIGHHSALGRFVIVYRKRCARMHSLPRLPRLLISTFSRGTPAMEAGLTDHVWAIAELLA
jgi:hypothetical protein